MWARAADIWWKRERVGERKAGGGGTGDDDDRVGGGGEGEGKGVSGQGVVRDEVRRARGERGGEPRQGTSQGEREPKGVEQAGRAAAKWRASADTDA